MDCSPRNTYLLLISLSSLLHPQILPRTAFSDSKIFHFPPFSHANLSLHGSSILLNGSLWLTSNGNSIPSSSFGAALFHLPAAFTSFFSTNFYLSVFKSNNDSSSRNGLVFFLAPISSIPALFHSPHATKTGSTLTVEFSVILSLKVRIDIERIEGGEIAVKAWAREPGFIVKNSVFAERYNPTSKHFVKHICMGLISSNKINSEFHIVIESWSVHTSSNRKHPLPASRITLEAKRAPKPPVSRNTRNPLGILLGAAIPAVAAVAIFALVCANAKRWLDRKVAERKKQWYLKKFRKFKFSRIKALTNDFNPEGRIGFGDTYDVYRMTLPRSTTAYAVKRFRKDPESTEAYLKEIRTMRRIRHENIIELQGWCDQHPDEHLLIYHLMPNETIHKLLHLQEGRIFPWSRRYSVAVKIASALKYLHEECNPPIVHCGINSENILLGEDYEPKVANFGLALDRPTYFTGSFMADSFMNPYAAPEYWPIAMVDSKADVYSYGVLVLEICTGRKPTLSDGSFEEVVRKMQAEDRLLDAADRRLVVAGNGYDPEEMKRLLRVGLACTEDNKERRPTMARVLQVLRREAEVEGQGIGESLGKCD